MKSKGPFVLISGDWGYEIRAADGTRICQISKYLKDGSGRRLGFIRTEVDRREEAAFVVNAMNRYWETIQDGRL